MYKHLIQENILFFMFYAAVAMMASCYLLLRQGNAFAADITSPVRLRRWTAAFFACIALGHVWYLPTYFLSSSDDIVLFGLIGGLLDESDIHTAKESELKIVDWERTYFLTNTYFN
ncbi:MAG: hypothetical protein IJT97_02540 [Bacteroidaceae bacterium]|nr:hypothetical protein [Bacteroidaceae bacterium]